MDYRMFRGGLLSLTLLLFLFSLTFLIASIVLKPYIALEPIERDFIIVTCIINMCFSGYYLMEMYIFTRVYKLEIEAIEKFGKRIGGISLAFLVQSCIFFSLLFMALHNLQLMMIALILMVQVLILGIVFKEVYDLVFREENERDFEIKRNRKLYFDIE